MATVKKPANKATVTKTEPEQKAPVNDTVNVNVESSNSTPTTDSQVDAMMAMMKQMQEQMAMMATELSNTKNKLNEANEKIAEQERAVSVVPVMEVLESPSVSAVPSNNTEKFLEVLASRKADKEVTIVHNREMTGGTSTHLKLGALEVDLRTMGETRTLTWGQFEQCASKYRKFFQREIILVADENRDVAEKYNLPCVKRNGVTLIRSDLDKLPSMSTSELEKLYNSLTQNDKDFLISYWMGKCYSREAGFYDRYKIEFLNHLNGKHAFDNVLALMNGEFSRQGQSTMIETGNPMTQKPQFINS